MTLPQPKPVRVAIHRYWPVLGLIACNVLVGLLIFRDYGMTVDEPGNMEYGQYVIDYYRSGVGSNYSLFGGGSLDQKGPAYFVAAKIFANLGHQLMPSVGEVAFWHLADFLLFQLAVFCLYDLALRWMDTWGAFGAAALFATQPLLFGHAFINPKDSPFMVLFLASIAFGLRMADRVLELETSRSLVSVSTGRDVAQQAVGPRYSRGISLVSLGGLILVAFLAGAAFSWRKTIVTSLVQHIHGLASDNLIRIGYTYLAARPILDSAKRYVLGDKGFLTGIIGLLVVVAALFFGIAILSRKWPDRAGWFGRRLAGSFRDIGVVLAGVLLGLTVSIRVLGPYAGALVVLWIISKGKWKAVPAVLAYIMIALLIAYVTWPFLWANPLARFLESARLMADYPWFGRVLFNGQFFPARNLPALYIPTLMAIQLTEPVLILFSISLFLIGYRVAKNKWGLDLILLLLMWLVLPTLAFAATHRPIYDNIRQLHFLIPPVFLVAGVAISWILLKFRGVWMRVALLALILMPGILQVIQLHPYEYVYYNLFVGGLRGASRRFEPDYWAASTAEAARYVNQVAAPQSAIFTILPALLKPYLRNDLQAYKIRPQSSLENQSGYVLVSTRRNIDYSLLPDGPVLHVIEREGMVFMLIKEALPDR